MSESHPAPAAMTAAVQAVACSSTTIDGVFRRAFTVFADRVAVAAEDTSMTYAKLRHRAWQLANALTALGLGRGSRIAVLSETRPEYVETYAGCAALGVTVVALNIRLHPEELLHCLEKGKPCALISSGPLTPLIASLRDRVHDLRHWIALDPTDGWLDYGDLLAAASADEPPRVAEPEDIHNVLFTSGTTGRPKGAMISQRAAAVRGLRIAQWYRLTETDGHLGWLPLFHCGGDELLYATLISGGVFATLRKAVVETMFSMIERHRLTWTALLPGVITEFLNHPRRRDHNLSSLRFAIGYANMMPDIVAQLTAACGIDFQDAFGQTKSSLLVAHGFSRPGEMPSLRKHPTPLLDIRIVDDAMNEMPVGEPGECVVRGPSVMRQPVSTSHVDRVSRGVEPGLKDAARRRRRSPSAILDTGFETARYEDAAGTKERPSMPNQGTLNWSGCALRTDVVVGLIGFSILPGPPEHADPGAGEDADGVRMIAATTACAAIDGLCPGRGMSRVVGKADDGSTQSSVAGPAKHDGTALAGLLGDRGAAGLHGKCVGRGKAFANAAEFCGDLSGADVAGAGKGHDHSAFRQLGDGVSDACGERGDLCDQPFKGGGESKHDFAAGVLFGVGTASGGGGSQAGEQVCGTAPSAIAMLGEECAEALLSQPSGAMRCWETCQEGQRNRAVDVGEDCRCTGPKAFEQATQLVGELHAGHDQIIAPAHQCPQCTDRVGLRPQWRKAVAISAQQIGEQAGVVPVVFSTAAAITRSTGFDGIGMDRDDRMASLDQGIDQQARGTFDCHRHLRWDGERSEPAAQSGKAVSAVRHFEMLHDDASSIHDTDGMRATAPVETNHVEHSNLLWLRARLAPVGRPGGSLITRRSGRLPLARQPVARSDLPAPAARLVSRWPIAGERRGPSRRGTGSRSQTPPSAQLPVRRVH